MKTCFKISSCDFPLFSQIAKNRFDGDLGVMVLTFNKESLSFTLVEKKKPVGRGESSHTEGQSSLGDDKSENDWKTGRQ